MTPANDCNEARSADKIAADADQDDEGGRKMTTIETTPYRSRGVRAKILIAKVAARPCQKPDLSRSGNIFKGLSHMV